MITVINASAAVTLLEQRPAQGPIFFFFFFFFSGLCSSSVTAVVLRTVIVQLFAFWQIEDRRLEHSISLSSRSINVKEAYGLMGTAVHRYKNIKTLRSL